MKSYSEIISFFKQQYFRFAFFISIQKIKGKKKNLPFSSLELIETKKNNESNFSEILVFSDNKFFGSDFLINKKFNNYFIFLNSYVELVNFFNYIRRNKVYITLVKYESFLLINLENIYINFLLLLFNKLLFLHFLNFYKFRFVELFLSNIYGNVVSGGKTEKIS